ncbi:uncharacterized protein LOC129717348 [Wyeomyia smithii]|uniref:uncharacterized protein LOC129717348 n=1 Tax=Wyeomyia smithii TaxID=174621 RepID=UPI002467CE87|nr:uncharacterized protein LOC129717348 [Wyeomyia smithii]
MDKNCRQEKSYLTRRESNENNFKSLYRFTREHVDFLAKTFLDDYNEIRGGALNNVQKMKCFLRYIGDPGFQVGVGEDLGFHQTTVCKTHWFVAKNILHTKERVIIERVFGQVKQRFPILQSKVRIATERVPTLIIACFTLHNVAKFLNDDDFDINEISNELFDFVSVPEATEAASTTLHLGKRRRDAIASFINEWVQF